MKRVMTASLIAAVGALTVWRKRRSLSPYWESFRTFSAPSAKFYDVLAARVLPRMYSHIARDLASAGLHRGSVLDVGCGPGHLALEMAGLNPELRVTGVDISEEMVALATSHAVSKGLADRVSFRVGESGALPFGNGQFDMVVSSLSLHHWPDAAQGLREIHRVLKPGGRAAIYDVAKWLMHVERHGPWLDALAGASPFPDHSLKLVWGVGPIPILWRLSLHEAA